MSSPQTISHRGGGAFGPQVAVPSSPVPDEDNEPDEVDELMNVAINPTETIVAAAEQLNAEFIQQQSESVRVTLPTRSSRTLSPTPFPTKGLPNTLNWISERPSSLPWQRSRDTIHWSSNR